MITLKLTAEVRKTLGRKVKTLRKQGLVPANIYGKSFKSKAVQVKFKDFEEIYKKAGETGIVEIKLGKEEVPVLIHNAQVHPVTGEVLHVDFLQVNLKEKVTADIPVEVSGESPAEKSGVGTVVQLIQELEVEALPTDLPDKFEVDASKLEEVDQLVKVSDLKYDKKKVEIKAEADEIVVKVEPPQKEEVIPVAPVVEEVPVEGEAPKEGEEKPAEGEKPQEGKAAEEQKPQEQSKKE